MAGEAPTYLAVVPAYNEADTIGAVVGALGRHHPEFDVLVVDDGSTDHTRDVAELAGAQVLRHPFNIGIGGAVQSGFQYACDQGYDYVAQVDADCQHDPREISKLLAAMRADPELDMVCGSRFLDNGVRYRGTRPRRVGIRLFAGLLSRIVGQRITDPTSGFRLSRRRAIALFARDYPHDFPEVEAVLTLHYNRLTTREVPVRMYERGGGVSSIGTGKSLYYMVKVLLAIFIGMARARPFVERGDAAPVAGLGRI